MARHDSSGEPRRSAQKLSARAPALTVSKPALLHNGSDQDFRRLVHNLFAFFARHSAIREGHGAVIGLAGIEYTILISIRHLSASSEIGVIEVARHLHLSGPFTTTIINKLLAKGLIAKEPHPHDKRRVLLSVTSIGNDVLDKLAPTQMQVNDVQFGVLSQKEFELLLDVTERLVKSSDEAVALQSYLSERRGDNALEVKRVVSRKKRSKA